jgi:hypothetical protein
MKAPRSPEEADAMRTRLAKWRGEGIRLARLAGEPHMSPERRDGLNADIAEVKRTIRRYESVLCEYDKAALA